MLTKNFWKEYREGKGMYLDTDMILALTKKDDWLKPFVNLKKIKNPVISSAVLIELELVINREYGKGKIDEFFKKLKDLKIKSEPITPDVVHKSPGLMKKYNMNTFDAIHAAYCITNKEDILSSDTIFDSIKEIKRVDPRELK